MHCEHRPRRWRLREPVLATTLALALLLLAVWGGASDLAAKEALTVKSLRDRCRIYLKLPRNPDPRKLTKRQIIAAAQCSAYVIGFHHGKMAANALTETTGPYCLPAGATEDQLIATFVRWAGRNRWAEKKPAGFGLLKALIEVAGCGD